MSLRPLAAALLLCLLPAAPAAPAAEKPAAPAAESPAARRTAEAARETRFIDARFRAGMAAAARAGGGADERAALLDETIAAFHFMLARRPALVRVRLELARAFFLKGEDKLARRHFEQVLAGRPPPGRRRRHPALPADHSRPAALVGLFRPRHRPGQQPQHRLRGAHHLAQHRLRAACPSPARATSRPNPASASRSGAAGNTNIR